MKQCDFCGEQIQDEAVKCKHCKEWIQKRPESQAATTSQHQQSQSQKPLLKQDNSSTQLKAAIGEKNTDYYLTKFEEFDKQGSGLKASWNWPAFFCSGVWALYRKMYVWFFAFWGIVTISNMIEKSGYSGPGTLIFLVPFIAFPIFANSLYHGSLKNKIAKAKSSINNEAMLIEYLRHKGGVHQWVAWVFGLILPIGIIAAILIPGISWFLHK